MDMLIQLFALLVVCIFVRGVNFYASKQVTLWGQSNCTLALPNLNYTDSGIFVETEHGLNLTLPEEGLWIDLFQAQLGFTYVGCNEMNNSGVILIHNISECRWKSGCNTFAIRKKDSEEIECKCFDESVVAKERECTSTCSITSKEEYKCGQKGRSYFSVYTVENDTQCTFNCNYNGRKCLISFLWRRCSYRILRNIGIVCNKSPFTESNGTVEVISKTASNYTDAGEKCFAEGMFPATLSHMISTDITTTESYWTGVMRMNSLLRVNETFPTYGSKKHAYVTQDGTRLDVRFDDSGTVRRKSLCETPNFVGTTATATESLSTSTSIFQETTDDTSLITKVDQRIPIAEISASVSAVVVLGILIVSFVILSKRGGLLCFGERKTTMTNEEPPMQYMDTKYTEPQTRDLPKAYPNQGYSKTEGLPISTKNYTPGKPQIKDHTVDVNKVANTKNKPQDIQHIAHVHNNLYQEPEEYDHLNHPGITDNIPINDYDSTTAAKGENKDDLYNHLNECPQQRTENVYGMHNKNETTDKYNKMNERPERKHIMENIYGMQDKNETENEYDIAAETRDTCKNMSKKVSGFNYDKVNKNW